MDDNLLTITDETSEYWTITNNIKWVNKSKYLYYKDGDDLICYGFEKIKVLQQMWQGSLGSQDWKDVPIEDE